MIVANGSTSVSTYFVLRDSTNHAPKTDVAITDIDLYYQLPGAAQSAKVDAAALAAADSAWDANKAYHCGNGLYRIDWPDTCFDGGVGTSVYLIVVCTGVDTTFLEVELSPQVNTNSLTANAITATAINADAITNAKIADDAIAVENIKDAAITAAKIAADAIELAKIKDGAISAAKFAANAITSTVIADDAITAAKLNTGAITADAFAADAIVAATLNTGCLTSDAFAANAITNAAVADDVDVNVKTITAGAITAAAIATDAIDDDAIAANVTAVIAAAVWNAETASYGGAGTYGQAVEDVLTDTGTTLDTLIKDIPTVAEFEARTIAAADYTVVGDLGVVQTGDSFAIVNGDHGLVSIQDDIDSILADTNEVQGDLANGGRLDLLIDGIKAKTDSLTFTVGNQVDANIQYINDTAVTGDGDATPWGPV